FNSSEENPQQFKSPFHPSFARESCGLDEPWLRPSSGSFRAVRQPRRVSDPPKRSRSAHSLKLGDSSLIAFPQRALSRDPVFGDSEARRKRAIKPPWSKGSPGGTSGEVLTELGHRNAG